MNRNTVIVLAVIVVSGLVVGAVFVLPLFVPPPAMSTLVEFHDKDGNLIDVPMAIQADGKDVSTMTVTVSWLIEGENLEPNTFNVHIKLRVRCKDRAGVWVQAASIQTYDSDVMVSSWSYTWTLVDILDMEQKDIGWELEIWATLYATATDLEGNPIVPVEKETPAIYPTLTWNSQTGSLSIIQCAVTKAYPP